MANATLTNGQPSTGNPVADAILGTPKTAGYRPTVVGWPLWLVPNLAYFNLADVESMRLDPQVNLCLAFRKAPICTAEFDYECDQPEVGAFLKRQVGRLWKRSLAVILDCLDYGYSASEVIYRQKKGGRWDGAVEFDGLKGLHPRDVSPWTVQGNLAFIRVRSVQDNPNRPAFADVASGVDLEAATEAKPAKGLWITHGGRYHAYFGRSVLFAGWRPWKDKTGIDGGLDNVRAWFYRMAYKGFTIRAPNEQFSDPVSGNVISGMEYGRQLGEWLKAGGNVVLPSNRDENGNPIWEVEWGEMNGDPAALIAYIGEFLDVQIQRGIGIPDGIITESGGTGAYAGRRVPEDAFYVMCEEDLNHIISVFTDQVLKPLVRLNFGEGITFEIKPKPLVPVRQQMAQGQQQGQQIGQQPPPQTDNPQMGGPEDDPGGDPNTGDGGDPNQPPADQWLPYFGRRGGRGLYNPFTGQRHYQRRQRLAWSRYEGRQGGMGWRNAATGEIRYQDEMPQDRAPESEETPAATWQPGILDPTAQARRLLHAAARAPQDAVKKATGYVARQYRAMEAQLGQPAAVAVVGASLALIPLPFPGSTYLPIGLAKVWMALKRGDRRRLALGVSTEEFRDEPTPAAE